MTRWDRIKNLSTRFRGLTLIGLANIIASVIGALFWLYIARLIGTASYGEVSYFIAISGIGVIISFMGAGSTLQVYAAKGIKIQSTIYFIVLLTSTAASIIIFVIFQNVSMSVYLLGNVVYGMVTAEALGKKSYKTYFIYVVMQRGLMAVLAIFLYHMIGVNGIILGIGISFLLCSVGIYNSFRSSKIDFAMLKPRLAFVMNSYLLDITRTFSTSVDKLIIAPLFGFVLLGNYQLGIQVLSVLTIMPGVVYNYILSHDASGNPNRLLKKFSILLSVLFAILSIILAPILLPVFFPKFTHAIEVIQIVSLAVIPISISNTYISKFMGHEKNRIVLIGSGIFLTVQITTIIFFGKFFGINGIASSFLVATSSEALYLALIDRYYQKSIKT
jgi:O-antigen/teichoic acid export membrane protein